MSDSEALEDVKESISSEYIKVDNPGEDSNSSPEMISATEADYDEPRYDEPPQQADEDEPEPEEEPLSIPSTEPSYPPYKETMPPPLETTPPPLEEMKGVEDVGTASWTNVSPPTGSPSRPALKSIEVPKAKGYLSFLNFLSPTVLYIIYWRNVKLSALSLGMSLVILLTLHCNTLLHTTVLMLLASMVVALVYIVTKIAIDSFYNNPIVNPFQSYLESSLMISEEDAVHVTKIVLRKLNCYYRGLIRLVLFHNTLKSLKLMVFLFLLSYVTNYFSFITLLFVDLIGLFAIPVLYEHHQIKIDQTIAVAFDKMINVYSLVQRKLSFLPKLKSE